MKEIQTVCGRRDEVLAVLLLLQHQFRSLVAVAAAYHGPRGDPLEEIVGESSGDEEQRAEEYRKAEEWRIRYDERQGSA